MTPTKPQTIVLLVLSRGGQRFPGMFGERPGSFSRMVRAMLCIVCHLER